MMSLIIMYLLMLWLYYYITIVYVGFTCVMLIMPMITDGYFYKMSNIQMYIEYTSEQQFDQLIDNG
jgi:hypothetical protein